MKYTMSNPSGASKTFLKLRLARESDYNQVVKLSETIKDSMDILPWYFHDWLKDSEQILAVAEQDAMLIGLLGIRIVDEATTLIIHSVRIETKYRGGGMSHQLKKYGAQVALKRFPCIKKFRYTFEFNNRAMTNLTKNLECKIVSSRHVEFYAFNDQLMKTWLQIVEKDNRSYCELFMYTAKEFLVTDGLRKANELKIIRDGLIFDAWWPLGPVTSNISAMHPESLVFLTDWRVGVDTNVENGKTKSLSHGNCLKYGKQNRLQISVYSEEPQIVQNHLLQQFLYAYRHNEVITEAIITVYPGMREYAHNILKEPLNLSAATGYLGLTMVTVEDFDIDKLSLIILLNYKKF